MLEALILSGSMDALAPNRASLMLQLPEAVRAAEQRARDAEAGQHDMFGAVAQSVIESTPLPTTSEWPIERKLAGERETLGHYLSGHPTDSWRGLIARVATSPIGEIDQHYKPNKGGPAPHERRGRFSDQPYTIAGQVIAIRKRGDAMAFVQVEDWSGRIEVSLFREAWIEYGPLLTRDAILVFDGGPQLRRLLGQLSAARELGRDDRIGLRAHRARAAREAQRRARRFHRTPAARARRASRRRDTGAASRTTTQRARPRSSSVPNGACAQARP